MKIIINNTEYTITVDDNATTRDIIAQLPLEMNLTRFAGHEYYSELPFTPTDTKEHTSQLMAGHVYYWGGGNSFVINFAESDISPYSSVHIGAITDASATEFLNHAPKTISVKVIK